MTSTSAVRVRPGRLRLAAAALGLAALAACAPPAPPGAAGPAAGGCPPAPSQPVTVNLLAFSAPAIDPFADGIAKGCSSVANLTVNHAPVDFDAQLQKANLALSSGAPGSYDIVEVYDSTLVQYASKGWLVPLDDYIAKYKDRYGLGDIPDALFKEFSYDGKTYGVPNQQNVQILIYRKDVLDGLGIAPPKTYDELVAASDKIKAGAADQVKYPLAMAWGADEAITNGFNNALTGFGGGWFDPAGKATFDQAAGVQAIDAMKKLYSYMPPEALTFNNGNVATLMQQGQVAMTVIWASRAGTITDPNTSRVADKIGFAPAPTGVTGNPPATQWSQDGFAIAKNSGADPDLLFQLLAAGSTSPEVMRKAAPYALVARTSVTSDAAAQQPNWPAALSTIQDGARSLPHLPFMQLTLTAVRPFLADAVGGKREAQDALTAATAEVAKQRQAQGL